MFWSFGIIRRNYRVDDIVLLKNVMFFKVNGQWGESLMFNNDWKDLVWSVTLKVGECAGNKNLNANWSSTVAGEWWCYCKWLFPRMSLIPHQETVIMFFKIICYLEESHVKLHQDGTHLVVNIRFSRETCLPPKKTVIR